MNRLYKIQEDLMKEYKKQQWIRRFGYLINAMLGLLIFSGTYDSMRVFNVLVVLLIISIVFNQINNKKYKNKVERLLKTGEEIITELNSDLDLMYIAKLSNLKKVFNQRQNLSQITSGVCDLCGEYLPRNLELGYYGVCKYCSDAIQMSINNDIQREKQGVVITMANETIFRSVALNEYDNKFKDIINIDYNKIYYESGFWYFMKQVAWSLLILIVFIILFAIVGDDEDRHRGNWWY